jgi:hypothetical protein
MVTKETREKLIKQTKNIVVVRLNMDAINKDIDVSVKRETEKAGESSFAPKIEPNQFFAVRGKLGVIKGTNILIDDECIGEVSENPTLEIYSETRNEDGKTTGFSMFPSFLTKIKVEDLLTECSMEEVSLETFMGNRFCYNSRVCSNMKEIVKELKK